MVGSAYAAPTTRQQEEKKSTLVALETMPINDEVPLFLRILMEKSLIVLIADDETGKEAPHEHGRASSAVRDHALKRRLHGRV